MGSLKCVEYIQTNPKRTFTTFDFPQMAKLIRIDANVSLHCLFVSFNLLPGNISVDNFIVSSQDEPKTERRYLQLLIT